MSNNIESSRRALANTLERRFFYIPSFKIYGSVAGLYDYGSAGCKLKKNVLALWHQHFVLEENMWEIDCPCLTPEAVLKASGHVDKFTDLMVKDEKKGTCYRADHLLKDFCNKKLEEEEDRGISSEFAVELKEVLSKLDGLSAEELSACIKKYGIKAPETDNHPLSDPYPFSLMFQTSIGPSGSSTGFLRPETAQGIFVNFMDIYYDNGCKLPLAVAQVGQAFRNEKLVISPVKKEIGLAFKKKQKNVIEALDAMNEEETSKMKADIDSKGEADFYVCTLGEDVSIKSSMVTISKVKTREHQRKFTPSVIEPSFGIGRIIYCLFEHSFYTRPDKTGDEELNVFRFKPLVAPFKCSVFPLVRNQQFEDVAKDISKSLTAAGISHKMDTTGTSIGKRYARTDELGVPFAITVDSRTSVTIRERDSKDQIRVSVKNVASVVKVLSEGSRTWEDMWWSPSQRWKRFWHSCFSRILSRN